MSRADDKPSTRPWEFVVYFLVTVPLLVVGALLWLFGMILRLLLLFRRRDTNG